MAEKNSTFRKVSLDRLSSPEQLDQKITVVSPIGWIAASSLLILVVAALAWGFLGSISNKVRGSGILMYDAGIASITSHTGGRITDVAVQAGDLVERGQIIARIEQEELARDIYRIQTNIIALENINPETLDIDINYLNHELYSAFAQLAGQIRTSRIQHNAQRAEANLTEQDIAHRSQIQAMQIAHREQMQAQQISLLESQITMVEAQILQHQELTEHQNLVELEDAETFDRQQDIIQEQHATALRQLEYDLERASENYQSAEILYRVGGISRFEFDSYRNEITRIQADIETRLYDMRNIGPRRLDQIQNRPGFDAALASMQAQLENLRLQLVQAQAEEFLPNIMHTGYIWGQYYLTSVQITSLLDQFAHQRQIMRQDYLRRLAELQEQYNERSVITAAFDGVVSGLTIQAYDFVNPGSVIGNIVRGDLEAGSSTVILYVPLAQGTVVEVDMEVYIQPATVRREEHGYIIGRVVSVSASSVTQYHMLSTLQNMQLVHQFSGEAAVLEVEVELLSDTNTVSGFLWSTPRGAPFAITPGTICNGEIIVSYRRPIDMVVPFIRRLFL